MSTKLNRQFGALAVIAALGVFAACSSEDAPKKNTPRSTGGTAGMATGGKGGTPPVAGTGGMPTGGSAGTAGSGAGTGGSAGTAGSGAGTAGTAGSAGSSTGTAGSAGSAGAAGSAGDAGSAGTAGGMGEGGEGGMGSGCDVHPGTLYMGDAAFDEPGSTTGWILQPETGNLGGLGDGYVMRNLTEGHTCPGALSVTVPFTVYGAAERAAAQKASTVDWTGRTTLHAWVKIADPGGGSIAYLNGVQLFVQSMGYSVYSSKFVGAATFDDFGWHEIVLDLAAEPPVVLTDVNQVGIQVLAAETRPPSGPMTPLTTVMFIDDIYVE